MGSFHHYGEGAPFSRKGPHLTGEIGPPGPHITGRMGPEGPTLPVIWGPGGPNLGGPHSTVTPVRPVRPWPYQFLRRKNGVAGILTYERVASYIQSFLLGLPPANAATIRPGQTAHESWFRIASIFMV